MADLKRGRIEWSRLWLIAREEKGITLDDARANVVGEMDRLGVPLPEDSRMRLHFLMRVRSAVAAD